MLSVDAMLLSLVVVYGLEGVVRSTNNLLDRKECRKFWFEAW